MVFFCSQTRSFFFLIGENSDETEAVGHLRFEQIFMIPAKLGRIWKEFAEEDQSQINKFM